VSTARASAGWVLGLGAGLLVSACSWGRFDDLSDSAPVVTLERPDTVHSGFGSSLAAARLDDRVRLLVAGSPGARGAALFDLGTGSSPSTDAVDAHHCVGDSDPCRLARLVAGMGHATASGFGDDPLELCFIAGIGRQETQGTGLVGRCDDHREFILAVPDGAVETAIEAAATDDQPLSLVVSADHDATPALVAGFGDEQAAWYYPAGEEHPQPLVAPASPVDESYGNTVAVLRTEPARILAVGAPEQGHLWLFRHEAGSSPRAVGCWSGPPGFARTLAAGRVDDDDDDDLVVADDVNVTVFSGARLLELHSGTADCSLAALPDATVIASFGCGTTADVNGCDDGAFGRALAVGDLDGDGDGEVLVGAPRMTVRDTERAGAVLVFDVEPDSPNELSGVAFVSSAETGDLLGSALATPSLDEHDIIAAGAPGGSKVALFYCTRLAGGGTVGERCR